MSTITQESVMLITDSVDLQLHQRGAKNRLSGYPGADAIGEARTGEELLDALRAVARIANSNDKLDAEQYVVRVNRILRDSR